MTQGPQLDDRRPETERAAFMEPSGLLREFACFAITPLPIADGWFLILWLLCMVVAAVGWAVYFRLQAQRLPRRRRMVERAQPPAVLMRTVGGGRVGGANYSFPFVRFAVDEEGVVFRFPFSTAWLGWGDITRAVLLQPMIPVGRGVEFQLPRSQSLTVWAASDICAKILDLCEQHGVEVVRRATFRV